MSVTITSQPSTREKSLESSRAMCIVINVFSAYMAFTSTVTDSGYALSSPSCLGTQQGLRVQVDKRSAS